jgi:hypothetical protein
MRRAAGICVVLVALAAGCGSTKTVTVTQVVTTVRTVTTTKTTTGGSGAAAAPCSSQEVSARFAAIAGSAGAGQIGYELLLTNTSDTACSVDGVPSATLLDKDGGELPTQISAAPSSGAATPVVLRHGDSAKADARFSPDVPGPGEQQSGPCERTAYVLRVDLAGGTTADAPVKPPTAVCEQGSLSFSAFIPAA